ncbi:MAG: hypothetical protein M1524_03660 [Patescibacteria group bacterium]|nr:hypothetical protein [Patescibacteria group bacterium]
MKGGENMQSKINPYIGFKDSAREAKITHDKHHAHLVKELAEQLEPVFSNSPQGIYLYLDDTHKICNKKFADMLGYNSVEEWVNNEYPLGDVSEKDQEKTINVYKEASEDFKASGLTALIVKRDGKEIKTNIIMVPITYKGETFALHFVSEEK